MCFLFVVFLLCGVTSSFAVQALELTERHEASGLNNSFNYQGNSFSEYILETRAMLIQARTDLNGGERETILLGNMPFQLAPAADCPAGSDHQYRKGILLTHGLTDSPYLMKDLAAFFQAQCFRVFAVLLPGHGSRPGDLLKVRWTDWTRAVQFGADALAKEVDELYLGGFSTGAAAAIYQANRSSRVAGLILFSPAIAVSSLAPVSCVLNNLGFLGDKRRWIDLLPDEDHFKYESFPANAGCQISKLTSEIKSSRSSNPITVPLFVAASQDDTTVKTAATIELVAAATNPVKKMVLYGDKQVENADSVLELVSVKDQAKHLLSSAHTGIVKPAGDPHYGISGAYKLCAVYFDDKKDYDRCKAGQADYLGEVSKPNKKLGVVQRLTFNPKYDELLNSLSEFLNTIESRQF